MSVLCDTDFLISCMLASESTHERARKLYKTIASDALFITSLVKYELATVLSRKLDHALACRILKDLLAQPITQLGVEEYEAEALELFYAQTRKNISFVDCMNVVVAKKYGWRIASFDAFYPRAMVLGVEGNR